MEDHEEKPSTITYTPTVPLDELLLHTSMPVTAVAVKLCGEDSAEDISETIDQKREEILNTFKRRTFNRISFKGDSGPLLNRCHQTKFSSRRLRKRVVFKHGDCNVVQGNVAKRRRRYLQDIFTTLVDAQWRWTLLVFSMNFLLSWLGFAFIWWLIAYSHGDLESQNYNNETFIPCVMDIRNFASCFLFSVETQHTIGYGAKHATVECPEAIFTLCIQSMTGVILQAFMVGIVFAKLSRPEKRTQTLLFSRNAVICQRDGQPCLMFRVGDMRKSHIIEAHVRAQMIKRKVCQHGHQLLRCNRVGKMEDGMVVYYSNNQHAKIFQQSEGEMAFLRYNSQLSTNHHTAVICSSFWERFIWTRCDSRAIYSDR